MPVDVSAFSTNLDQTLIKLEPFQDFTDTALMQTLQRQIKTIQSNIETNFREGRKLSIGIMGTMKAGKSSFLNALFFNGQDILPKAATPMTASLTVLSYDPCSQAKITFFSRSEWDMMVEHCEKLEEKVQKIMQEEQEVSRNPKSDKAALYPLAAQGRCRTADQIRQEILNSSDEIRSFVEVIEMVKKNQLNVNMYLDKVEEIQNQDTEQFLHNLNEYVGADGKYTPLVSYIELKLNNDMLKDIEIIDTPGLNDPFTSRSNRTKEYLGKCDVVLYLCNVGQFLTESDVNFISRDMVSNATADAYLVGTQLDLGIRQYPKRNCSFKKAYGGSLDVYNDQVKAVLGPKSDQELVSKILKDKHTLYTSSIMYSIGLKKEKGEPLNEAENHVVQGLQMRFPDFDQIFLAPKFYFGFSGIPEIKDDVLVSIRAKKDQLIQEKNAAYLPSASETVLDSLNEIRQDADIKLQTLQDVNNSPAQRRDALLSKLDAIRSDVESLINEHVGSLRKLTESIKNEVGKATRNCRGIKVEKHTETDHYTTGMWWWKKDHYTTTVTQTASTTDVMANLRNFMLTAQEKINERLDSMNSRKELTAQLSKVVSGVFDLSDTNFNPNEIINPINNMLLGFEVMSVNSDAISGIEAEFAREFPSACVEGNTIHELRAAQERYLQRVQDYYWNELDKRMDGLRQFLERQSGELCENVKLKVKSDCEKIEQMCLNREENIKKLQQLLATIDQMRRNLI